MEATSKNVDRLVTVQMRGGDRPDRYIIPPLYESACRKLGGRPISLVAAERMIELIKPGDSVLLVTDFGTPQFVPYGETDGPSGVASLARAIRFGLNGIPVIVSGRAIESVRYAVKAAGINIMEYELAKETTSAGAVSATFPCVDKDESKKIADNMLDEYEPKALISVETPGPNKRGVKHFAAGTDVEAKYRLPGLEYLFYEAEDRGIFTIGIIDVGNEIGSGSIEEDVRKITPYANVCRCPCGAGLACSVKTDIVFPANISNWGAYAITAMVAYLLKEKRILQDVYTERRMLEACIMAGAVDGVSGLGIMAVDSVNHEAGEAIITLLHSIIGNALASLTLDRYVKS